LRVAGEMLLQAGSRVFRLQVESLATGPSGEQLASMAAVLEALIGATAPL
jgi:hypothetical protein